VKQDVLDALAGRYPKNIPSKETLLHPGIINAVAGFDLYDDTPRAYETAYRKLGIDIHQVLPSGNAPRPRVSGGTWEENGIRYADYGVFPTQMSVGNGPNLPVSAGGVFGYDTARDDFDPGVKAAALKQLNSAFRERFGELAVMYHLYYTTLFMWPIVTFGWEAFLAAAASDPERFDEMLWEPWAQISRKHFEMLAAMDEEVVFCHDDLAMSTGPVFRPSFYEKHIFPRYERIIEPVLKRGKKVVFVCDGNMDQFLERLLEMPFAAIMYESPATPYERIVDTWGKAGRGFIGGISTQILTGGTPEEVRSHTRAVIDRGRQYPGFIISSCGQLPGNIPMANIIAYFRTRNELGCPAELPAGST